MESIIRTNVKLNFPRRFEVSQNFGKAKAIHSQFTPSCNGSINLLSSFLTKKSLYLEETFFGLAYDLCLSKISYSR